MQRIERGVGLTSSEMELALLCNKTFLRTWSFPNLFRRPGQELCDVLVVFGDDVIIFSDKSCVYPSTGDEATDWDRWSRESVIESAKSTFGAERWLKEHPDRVFLDAKCTARFPFALPRPEKMRVHRIAVARKGAERCRAHFGEGTGSLMILGKRHPKVDGLPFFVFLDDFPRGFVHVLDDATLWVILEELDTVADFTSYLSAKEDAFRSGRIMYASGEEEILAVYLMGANGERGFNIPEGTNGYLAPGGWEFFRKQSRVLAKKEADRKSYLWDEMIGNLSLALDEGTIHDPLETGAPGIERCIREMAMESRYSRRLLADAFFSKLASAPAGCVSERYVSAPRSSTRGYAFVVFPRVCANKPSEYREERESHLFAYLRYLLLVLPNLESVLGIATDQRLSETSSEDVQLLLRYDVSSEERTEILAYADECGWSTGRGSKLREAWGQEYPAQRPTSVRDGGPSRAPNGRKKRRKSRQASQRRNR